MKNQITFLLLTFTLLLGGCQASSRQKDVLRVMTYNVLKYGDGCQGPVSSLHGYLRTIIDYADPDIVGLIKVEAIAVRPGVKGKAPADLASAILANAFNAARPGRYAYAPFSNAAQDNNQNLLYYNKHKLGLAGVTTILSDISDFNMYKLYYLEPDLAKRKDTVFLYVVLVHADSGDKPDDRDRQMTELMKALRQRFSKLPDLIVMGDFNLRKSKEQGYQVLTNNSEKSFCLQDPPFAIDHSVTYPANWDKHPESYAAYLTTSTRKKEDEPNNCGTGGGAKGWYDHILLAPALTNGNNYYHYVRRSYKVVGNDGQRIDKAVNKLPNSSAPAGVLEALYQLSNKYPVTIELGITPGK